MIRQRKALQRRTPLIAETPLSRSTPLRSSGPVKARRRPMGEDELAARLLVTARSGGRCEIRIPSVCTIRATDWCHRLARGRGGKWCASNGLAGCRACHRATTNTNGHRADFERLGWIVRTGADPASVPVFADGRWVLLTRDGLYYPIDRQEASPQCAS